MFHDLKANNQSHFKIKKAFAVTVVSLVLTSFSIHVSAQTTESSTHTSDNIVIRFQQQQDEEQQDGSSKGRPNGRKGTGSRSGSCPIVNTPMTALIPENDLGLTLDKSPTLWVSLPYKPTEISSGEFSLQDEDNNDIYRTSLIIPEKPGIVSFTIPPEVSLESNKKYKWFLKIYCQDATAPGSTQLSDFVYGWLQHISPPPQLENRLKKTTVPRERIALYAQNGIWYTTLTDLAKLRLANPTNPTINQDWANLLHDIGLDYLTKEPIVGSLEPRSPNP
ncbi:MAG: DUF928 domain-containing protein [Scytonema sp. PMC 1069.18]|nr:DUF928 domain-containing protein [Scytonema sp. PMC 1069.18]MEC4884544.1 DUF928 domain-containing protein [Scytonema sp. PMC 1070.18]